MACKSLTQYARECGNGIAGGVSKLWLISFYDLGLVTGTDSTYSFSTTTGMVTDIELLEDKLFVPVGLLRNTVGITENLTKTPATGTFEITTELTLVISNITAASRLFVESLTQGEVAAIIKLSSGNYVVAGLDGALEATTIVGGSGVAGADLNGYTITLTGVETSLLRLVDPTIIPTITEAPVRIETE